MPFTAAMTGFHRSFCLGLMLAPGSLYMNGVETLPVLSPLTGFFSR